MLPENICQLDDIKWTPESRQKSTEFKLDILGKKVA